MPTIAPLIRTTAVLAFAATLWGGSAYSQMAMTLYGQPGNSIVSFELSGTTQITTFSGNITGFGGDLSSFNAIELPLGSVDHGVLDLVSGGGVVSNLTQMTAVPITNLYLQDRTATGPGLYDRFGVVTPVYSMSFGDTIGWAGSGMIDLAQFGATFDNLNVGSGTGPAGLPTPSGITSLTIIAVPEPTTTGLACVGLLLLTRVRRSR